MTVVNGHQGLATVVDASLIIVLKCRETVGVGKQQPANCSEVGWMGPEG